jgi:UDP-N-acetyl-D-mannosaminuronate dehydrogenase
MHLHELKEKIESKEAKLAVIGLGYVGLPVACAFAEAGFNVVGVERQEERVALINAGVSPIEGDEPGLAELVHTEQFHLWSNCMRLRITLSCKIAM